MPLQPENIAEVQREVQRKLGRNLLRIQQLEVMVKSMVAHSVIESESGDMHSFLDKRKQDIAKKTLGQVVGDLTTDLISLPAKEEGQQQERPGDPTKIWFRMSFRIEMSPEDHQRTQRRLAELVEMRNELVHHFIEIHDIWTVAGCASADAYLDDSAPARRCARRRWPSGPSATTGTRARASCGQGSSRHSICAGCIRRWLHAASSAARRLACCSPSR